MPYAYLQKVRAVPGVVAAISWNWFGGTTDVSKGVQFPNFAVDPEGFGEVYADWKVDPQVFEDFRKYRDAALVGPHHARRRWAGRSATSSRCRARSSR